MAVKKNEIFAHTMIICDFCRSAISLEMCDVELNFSDLPHIYYTSLEGDKYFCSKDCAEEYNELYNKVWVKKRIIKPFNTLGNQPSLYTSLGSRRTYSSAYIRAIEINKERINDLKSTIRAAYQTAHHSLGHSEKLRILERNFAWYLNNTCRHLSEDYKKVEPPVSRCKRRGPKIKNNIQRGAKGLPGRCR